MRELLALAHNVTMEVALGALFFLEVAAVLTVPSVLLRRRGRPLAALAWLLVLFALPAAGVLAWWLFGRMRIERKLRAHAERRHDFSERSDTPQTVRGTRFEALLPGRARGEYAFATGGNAVQLLADGEAAFSALERELKGAQRCVHLLFYIFKNDDTGQRICELLKECAKRGVQVRLLVDGFGSGGTVKRLSRVLEPDGVQVAVFLPSRFWAISPRLNFSNHRKLVTIDNQVAITGGMNIGDEYRHEWRDLMVRLEGPAVEGLNHIFLEDWFFATQEAITDPAAVKPLHQSEVCDAGVVSSGPDTEDWIHDSYFLAITQAVDRIYISTPYFIPTPPILTALRTAAGRGIDVRLVLPALSDVRLVMWASRSFYRALIEAGVRVYEYSGTMLHAKALVMDQQIASVGSANLDNRSFRLNFEVSCFLADDSTCRELTMWLEQLFIESEQITAETLDKKSTPRKLLESAAHLLSPLL